MVKLELIDLGILPRQVRHVVGRVGRLAGGLADQLLGPVQLAIAVYVFAHPAERLAEVTPSIEICVDTLAPTFNAAIAGLAAILPPMPTAGLATLAVPLIQPFCWSSCDYRLTGRGGRVADEPYHCARINGATSGPTLAITASLPLLYSERNSA